MASVFRVGVANLVSNNLCGRLCKVPRIHVTPVAYLSTIQDKIPKKKPPPYPYWKNKFRPWSLSLDPAIDRFDDNSKIIVVDGLPAVGKAKFCQFLAEKFGLLYMPAPNFDELYINFENQDLRAINKYFPLEDQLLDLDTFLKHPNHRRIMEVQMSLLFMRTEQYRNALVHILSTGQGIVLNRSVFSDFVFADAMFKCGYITQKDRAFHELVAKQLLPLLLRPQVVLYLDVPVKMAMDKIKQRGIPNEVNSSVFKDEKFLKELDHSYKENYIKSLMPYSYVVCFDWSKDVNLNSVIMELEDLPVEEYDRDGKQRDWVFSTFACVADYRKDINTAEKIFSEVVVLYDDYPESCIERPGISDDREEAIHKVFDPEDGFRDTPDEKFFIRPPSFTDVLLRRTPRDFMYRNIEGAK